MIRHIQPEDLIGAVLIAAVWFFLMSY